MEFSFFGAFPRTLEALRVGFAHGEAIHDFMPNT
jgi:hypothetical protein